MNSVKRFFRRYVWATIDIIVLFFTVNLLLVGAVFLFARANGNFDAKFHIEAYSDHIANLEGGISADTEAQEMLRDAEGFAMLLDDSGTVVWEDSLPEDIPRKYTATEVAMFSRWYLNDYPVRVWKRQDGLLVIGFPPESIAQYYFSVPSRYFPFAFWIVIGIATINFLLMVVLILQNTRRLKNAVEPVLSGIHSLSHGTPFHLEESGELADIHAGLNRAKDYLAKKENTRAEWIRGISHDIRTPLSLIMGYAGEIEDDPQLPPSTRTQARIILQKSRKLGNLVENLNLTTKLEYSMYPLRKEPVEPIKIIRQTVIEFLDEMPEQYEIEVSEDDASVAFQADCFLIRRMLGNLIWNCIIHNPAGCTINVSTWQEHHNCFFAVSDTGGGIDDVGLEKLNHGGSISSSQDEQEGSEHGMGLKIVGQIVKIHHGQIRFLNNMPQGLTVEVSLPLQK